MVKHLTLEFATALALLQPAQLATNSLVVTFANAFARSKSVLKAFTSTAKTVTASVNHLSAKILFTLTQEFVDVSVKSPPATVALHTITGALRAVLVSVNQTLLGLPAPKVSTSILTDALVFAPHKIVPPGKSGTTTSVNVYAFQKSAQITTGSIMKAVNVNANLLTVPKASTGKLKIAIAFAKFQTTVKQLKPKI